MVFSFDTAVHRGLFDFLAADLPASEGSFADSGLMYAVEQTYLITVYPHPLKKIEETGGLYPTQIEKAKSSTGGLIPSILRPFIDNISLKSISVVIVLKTSHRHMFSVIREAVRKKVIC